MQILRTQPRYIYTESEILGTGTSNLFLTSSPGESDVHLGSQTTDTDTTLSLTGHWHPPLLQGCKKLEDRDSVLSPMPGQ